MIDEQDLRIECLQLACKTCGDNVAYRYVLETARAYWGFVNGAKAQLHVVEKENA